VNHLVPRLEVTKEKDSFNFPFMFLKFNEFVSCYRCEQKPAVTVDL
jgi:hypothetical protein